MVSQPRWNLSASGQEAFTLVELLVVILSKSGGESQRVQSLSYSIDDTVFRELGYLSDGHPLNTNDS